VETIYSNDKWSILECDPRVWPWPRRIIHRCHGGSTFEHAYYRDGQCMGCQEKAPDHIINVYKMLYLEEP
jgi:hypothetical protein